MSWLAIAGALILAVISLLGENGLTEFLRLSRQRDQLAVQQADLSLETAELRRRLEALREDPVALETLARERYNMRREGEQVILLVTEEDSAASLP